MAKFAPLLGLLCTTLYIKVLRSYLWLESIDTNTVQAGAEAAEAAERERLAQLAADIKEFNRLKRLELSEAERHEW